MNLRDALLAALAGIPGPKRTYAVHVLVGAPKTTQDVYPYVSPRPKFSMQEIFVLCSEEIEDGKRVFVAALEAALYTHAPTRTAFLYVAKVDSTGQAMQGAPAPTRTLASAFVSYFADPKTRPAWFSAGNGSTSRAMTPVPPAEATTSTNSDSISLDPSSSNAAVAAAASTSSTATTGDPTLSLPAVSTTYDPGTLFVHVFARAQGQYLFPNSAEYPGKRVRGDAALCRWWRSALSEAARDAPVLGMYYIVPGMDAGEAAHVLGGLPPPGSNWVYGHPYDDAALPWPARGKAPGIAGLVPWFEDDAKSRFIDDLAATHDELAGAPPPSPRKKKRRRLEDGGAAEGEEDAEKQKEREKKRLGDLAKIGADEFWERMGFRQECSQGAITGFFVCAFGAGADGAGVGVGGGGGERRLPGPAEAAQRRAVVASGTIARVRAALMKQQEFASRERAVRSTGVVEELVRTLLCDSALAEPASRPASRKRPHGELAREDSPGAVQAGPGHAELYAEHVFGTGATRDEVVSGAGAAGASETVQAQQPAVTVLAVRRKKK